MLHSILATFQKLSYTLFTAPFQLNIVGLRNRNMISNKFNDQIVVFYKNQAGNWIVHAFTATTLPGLYWLRHPMKQNGTAILLPGQYVNTYQLGLHRGKYKALVQVKPVTVLRDNNKDAFSDLQIEDKETGLFGINIHRAAANETSNTIGKYSAGCQVFGNPIEFDLFIKLAETHKKLHGKRFTYTLLSQEGMQ